MKELLRKTIEGDSFIQTILIVERKGILTAIEKWVYIYENWKRQYKYTTGEYTAWSDTDVDILEALKCYFEEPANVPEGFWFDHP